MTNSDLILDLPYSAQQYALLAQTCALCFVISFIVFTLEYLLLNIFLTVGKLIHH